MNNIKIVILDFDGTIADTQKYIVDMMQQTLRELNLPECSREQCALMIGLPLAKTFSTMLKIDKETERKCAETYTRIYFETSRPGLVKPFPGVVSTINALHSKGITVTIASSRKRPSLEKYVKEMSLDESIRYIISAQDVEHSKPAPDMVIRTLDELGFKADEALVVGDAVFDIKMGMGAGTKTCAVTYGNGSVEEMKHCGADYIIDDFGKIMEIVDNQNTIEA